MQRSSPGIFGRIPLFIFAFLLLPSLASAADPLTTSAATANGSAYSFGTWSNSAVAVTLACAPGSSDCANISYCADTTNTCNPASAGTPYTGPVNISTEGVSYIRYASNNSTGGYGDTGSSTLWIDATIPSISISNDASSSWTNNDTISVGVSDSVSGIANTTWFAGSDSACGPSQDSYFNTGINATSMQAASDSLYQNKYICFRAIDAAGNRNYAASSKIAYLDTTAPSVNAGTDQSSNKQFTQSGAASDSGSGVSSYSWSQSSGSGTVYFGTQSAQSTAISASADSTYSITLSATDAAGNTGTGSFTLYWVTSAPGIAVSNPASSAAKSKIISASVPSGTLTMALTTGTTCDSSLPFVAYASNIFTSESDNGKRVCYRVVDSIGNTAYKLSEAVSGIDTTRPVLSLNGVPAATIEARSAYSDAGASAADSHDGDLTPKITAINPVNTSRLGTYTITYNVADAAGNSATQLSRTVSVVDTTKPVLSLLGNSTLTLDIRTNYTEEGATAYDNYDGNITSRIVSSGQVDTNAAGTYNITYDVSDSSGNKAAQAVRTVIVADSTFALLGGLLFAALGAIGVVAVCAAAYFLLFRKKRGGL